MKARSKYTGRIEEEYYDILRQEAKDEERTLTFIINRILKAYCKKKLCELITEKTLKEGKRITLKLPAFRKENSGDKQK